MGWRVHLSALYQPGPLVRLGMSVQTPTIYQLTESYYSEVYGGADFNEKFQVQRTRQYQYHTAWRWTGSAGFMVGRLKRNKIGMEFTYWEGSEPQYVATDGTTNFDPINQSNDNMQAQLQVRVGSEWAISSFKILFGYTIDLSFREYLPLDRMLENAWRATHLGIGWEWSNLSFYITHQNDFGIVYYSMAYADVSRLDLHGQAALSSFQFGLHLRIGEPYLEGVPIYDYESRPAIIKGGRERWY